MKLRYKVFGGKYGTFAEYVSVVEERALVPKPANLTFEQAASVGVAAITALPRKISTWVRNVSNKTIATIQAAAAAAACFDPSVERLPN